MKTKKPLGGLGPVLRGLSGFEARMLALLLLLALVFPVVSRASDEESTLSIEILSENITVRGEEFLVKALVLGNQEVVVRWHLPDGMSVVNGSLEVPCSGDCENELVVRVDSNSTLGPKEIGVEVEYV